MPPGQPRERPIISVDRGEGRIKAPRWSPILGAVLDRWSKGIVAFQLARTKRAARFLGDRALSFASDSIGMGTVALDRGMLLRWPDRSRSRRRRWAWTINRLRSSSSCKTAGFAGETWGMDETSACSTRLTNCGLRNEFLFLAADWRRAR